MRDRTARTPRGPYRQSERGGLYASATLTALEHAGRVYPCYCTPLELELSRRTQLAAGRPPRYAGTCRELSAEERARRAGAGARRDAALPRAARASASTFVDFVHGPQSFLTDDIGDFVIRRADGRAAFFFSNAVDDASMGVTQALRGEDHLTNTPAPAADPGGAGAGGARLRARLAHRRAPMARRCPSATARRACANTASAATCPRRSPTTCFASGTRAPQHGLLTLEEMARAFDTAHLGPLRRRALTSSSSTCGRRTRCTG